MYPPYELWILVYFTLNSSENSIYSFFSSPDPKGHVSYCHHWASVVCPLTFYILINSSEATGPIWTKLWWNGPWMAPFQNCVRWSRLPTKMATKLKIEKRGEFNIGPYGENVSKRFFSETTRTDETKLPRNNHWKPTNSTFSKSLHTNVGGQKHFLKGGMCPLFLPPAPASDALPTELRGLHAHTRQIYYLYIS